MSEGDGNRVQGGGRGAAGQGGASSLSTPWSGRPSGVDGHLVLSLGKGEGESCQY